MPPVVVASRSDDTVEYAAAHRLGLGVAFIPVDQMAQVTDKYYKWCQEAGWKPEPDQVVYRGSIYLGETDQAAQDWLDGRKNAGPVRGGIAMAGNVPGAVLAARAGEGYDLRSVLAGSASGDVAGAARSLSFIGGPDTVVAQMKAFHDQTGAGVMDLFFQQPGVDHRDIMRQLDLFGREVLPRIKEF